MLIVASKQDIENLLFKAGSHHSFYCLLVQYDKFTGEVRTAANAVVATDLWNKVYRLTGQPADSLDTQVLLLFNQVIPAMSNAKVAPPEEGSVWHEFYLQPEQYEQAVSLLDGVVASILDPAVSRRNRF